MRVSERPLMCSAAMADGSGDVVVGSSDHALYVVDPVAGCRKRTLYSKSTGHTEWVIQCMQRTKCCFPDLGAAAPCMHQRLVRWPCAHAAYCLLQVGDVRVLPAWRARAVGRHGWPAMAVASSWHSRRRGQGCA